MSDFISVGLIIFIAFMAMLPPTIAALAAFRQTRVIHGLVNSHFSSMKAELAIAKAELVIVQDELAIAKAEIQKLKQYIISHDKTVLLDQDDV